MIDQEKDTDQGVNARVEALLARTLAPHPPPENLRRQVRRRVAAEWEQQPLTWRERFTGLLKVSTRQRAWAAVAALAVVAVVAALVAPSGGVPVAGTVVGKAGTVAIALAACAGLALIIAWFRRRR
ncbi:MAG: hypothetical protein JXR84_27420 [Anaerolineae bacterium]|nr:hypothetical protein [Anaerolineae bacterium]